MPQHIRHAQGMAIDIRVKPVAPSRLRDTAEALRSGGVGCCPAFDSSMRMSGGAAAASARLTDRNVRGRPGDIA